MLLPRLLTLLLCSAIGALGAKYEGWSLYKVFPGSAEEIKLLSEQIDDWRMKPFKAVDVWREPTAVNRSVEILVSPDFQPAFEGDLGGINFTVPIPNIQRKIDAEQEEMARARLAETVTDARMSWGRVLRDFAPSTSRFSFKRYHTLDEIHDYMRYLKKKHPKIVQITTIGKGHEGGKLLVMQIASSVGDLNSKPSIWMDGGIHAREWVSPATILYFMTQLVEGYERDRNTRKLVDGMLWYFLPVMNPDGYKFSHSNDRFWRKNRRDLPRWRSKSRYCDQGVDLNRNFDWHHCGKGASTSPCSEIYCGKKPFSEPEAKAVSSYVKKLKRTRNLQAYLTFHSFSQIWMYPYGHEKRTFADNVGELKRLAEKATAALKRVHGTRYKTGTAADTLYEAAGGSDDWAHGVADVRYVYLVELRPCENCAAGFMLPAKDIEATGEETWAAVKVVGQQVLEDAKPSRRRSRSRSSKRIRDLTAMSKEDDFQLFQTD